MMIDSVVVSSDLQKNPEYFLQGAWKFWKLLRRKMFSFEYADVSIYQIPMAKHF